MSHLRLRSRRARDRRRSVLQFEALEGRIVLTSLQFGLFDTGVDASGLAAEGGTVDSHYALAESPGVASNASAFVTTGEPSWLKDTATSHWIAPAADQSTYQSSPGLYRYVTTFDGTSAAAMGHFSGQVAADNSIQDILINGQSIGFSYSSYTVFGTFTANANVMPGTGTNTIEFDVLNSAAGFNPTGLHVHNLTVGFTPTVAVTNPTATAIYGGTVTNTGTFADLSQDDAVTITSSQGTVTQSGTSNGTFTFTEPNVFTPGPVTITATDSLGFQQSTTFNIALSTPIVSGGGNTATAVSGGSGVAVLPNLTIDDTDGPNLTSASVSIGTNFTPGEDQLLFTNQNGISSFYDPSRGILTLFGSATPAQYQTALRSVQYQDINTNPVTANRLPRTITATIGPALYDPTTGHYYQAVGVGMAGISWTDAQAAASASTLFGAQGYLATLTSLAEDKQPSFLGLDGWLGANDSATPGQWVYGTGPEAETQFWQGYAGGGVVNGQFNAWAEGEPTTTAGANFVEYAGGSWVNLASDAELPYYFVEYGGTTGDPTLQLAATSTVTVSSTSNTPVVTSPTAATTVSASTDTITGTADAGSLVQVYIDINNNGTIPTGATPVASEQLTAGQTAYSIATSLYLGVNHLLVTATDSGAAESAPAVVPTITSDTIAPAAPVITDPTGPVGTEGTTYTITGTAEAGSLVQVFGSTSTTSLGQVQLAAGQTAFSLTVPLTTNTSTTFSVTATDAAGNTSLAAVVPTIFQTTLVVTNPTLTGIVYLSHGTPALSGLQGLPLRVVFLDLDGSGVFKTNDPIAVTGADGRFAFTNYTGAAVPVLELPSADSSIRLRVATTFDEFATTGFAFTYIGVTQISPIDPVPLVTNVAINSSVGNTLYFVQQLYAKVLGRTGSLDEVVAWNNAITTQGLTNGQVALAFVNSYEHRVEQVASYYRNFLNRDMDPLASGWVADLVGGMSEQAVVEGILNSAEYQATNADPATFVQNLYLEVLGRQGGDSEVAAIQGVLGSGTSRAAVVRAFVESYEADQQLVDSYYSNDLQRQREEPISDFWVNSLLVGVSAGNVDAGILVSAEFSTMAIPTPPGGTEPSPTPVTPIMPVNPTPISNG